MSAQARKAAARVGSEMHKGDSDSALLFAETRLVWHGAVWLCACVCVCVCVCVRERERERGRERERESVSASESEKETIGDLGQVDWQLGMSSGARSDKALTGQLLR